LLEVVNLGLGEEAAKTRHDERSRARDERDTRRDGRLQRL